MRNSKRPWWVMKTYPEFVRDAKRKSGYWYTFREFTWDLASEHDTVMSSLLGETESYMCRCTPLYLHYEPRPDASCVYCGGVGAYDRAYVKRAW